MSIERLSTIWPEWKVTEKLGEGSFGKVYKIVKEGRGVASTAAVKVLSIPQNDSDLASLRAEGFGDAGVRAYFEGIVNDFTKEIKLMKLMKGITNVVSIEDHYVVEKTNTIGWDIFIRMELLTPLNNYLAGRRLSEVGVVKLGYDICTALELCAQRGIVHRDIKPENIFVSPTGVVKLGDFGIARELEKTGSVLFQGGTYSYMAPEIFHSRNYETKTIDIYSLGIVLYQLLNNNRLPFSNPNTQLITYQERKSAFERRINGEALPPPINANPHLAPIILKACTFKPADRFQTPTAFKNALSSVVKAEPSSTPKPIENDIGETYHKSHAKQEKAPVASSSDKRPKMILISLLVLILVGAGAVGALYMHNPDSFSGAQRVITNILGLGDWVGDVIYALEAGDHERALEIAVNISDDALTEGLGERLDTLEYEFFNETIEYSVIMMELNTIERMDVSILNQRVASTRDIISRLNESRIAFNAAESLFEQGSYEAAIVQYMLVIQNDPNYNRALTGLRIATDALRNEALTSAENYSVDGEYEMAINVLSKALLVIENDSELTQQLDVYKISFDNANRQRILDTAANYVDDNEWSRAISFLNNVLQDILNDAIVEERLRSYKQDYVIHATSQADRLVRQGSYDDAIFILSNVLYTLPGNAQIIEQISRVEGLRPVSLASIAVAGSNLFGYDTNQGSFWFRANLQGGYDDGDFSYAVFNLNQEFSRFSANLVAQYDLFADGEFLLEIMLDENPAFVKSIEDFNVHTSTMRIDVNVTNAATMTITVRGRGDYETNYDSVHLVNAELTR